jgi:hypothetical protein
MVMKWLWITLGASGAALFAIAIGRLLWDLRPRHRSKGLPPTYLERMAWVGLAVSTVVGVGLAAMVAIGGASAFHGDTAYRGIFWVLVLAGIVTWFGASTAIKRRHGASVVDERDRAILARSLSVESFIALVSLVAWTVALTEVFWEDGAVPLEYLQLLFWTTFIGGLFGRSLGVLLGYRQETTPHA